RFCWRSIRTPSRPPDRGAGTPYTCGAVAAEPLPKSIGRYEILRLLGRGGMGEVYLASDSALGRHVAIKILPAALQSDAKMRGRFMNEARAVAALNHPNVITIHDLATTEARDAGFPPGALYLVLEYLEGEGLDEIMYKRRLSITECLDIAIQALEGLKIAHQSLILHRDITPSNLMLAPDGRVKVLDFGLSKLLAEGARDTSCSHRQTGEGMIVGTLDYLSPEQALGNPLDERSDLFSFGIVFYQMLAGVHPFSGASVTQMVAKMMTKEADPWPEPDLVPEALKQIVAKALKKEPLERYGSHAVHAVGAESRSPGRSRGVSGGPRLRASPQPLSFVFTFTLKPESPRNPRAAGPPRRCPSPGSRCARRGAGDARFPRAPRGVSGRAPRATGWPRRRSRRPRWGAPPPTGGHGSDACARSRDEARGRRETKTSGAWRSAWRTVSPPPKRASCDRPSGRARARG